MHPKTRNIDTTSARRAVGSLDVLRSYRNPCFKHVSWTSLRVMFSEIRDQRKKVSNARNTQNCLKKRERERERENLLIITEKLKNARQRDRFRGRFIPAFREIQDHLYVVTCLRARKEDGRKALLNKVRFECVVFFLLQNPKKKEPSSSSKPRIELRAKKGNFYDETMAADNEKEEEIEDEEVRFS